MTKVIKGGTTHLIVTSHDKEDKGQKKERSDFTCEPISKWFKAALLTRLQTRLKGHIFSTIMGKSLNANFEKGNILCSYH